MDPHSSNSCCSRVNCIVSLNPLLLGSHFGLCQLETLASMLAPVISYQNIQPYLFEDVVLITHSGSHREPGHGPYCYPPPT